MPQQKVDKAYTWPSDDPDYPQQWGFSHDGDERVRKTLRSKGTPESSADELGRMYRDAEVYKLSDPPPTKYLWPYGE